jgi:hypothetical protein
MQTTAVFQKEKERRALKTRNKGTCNYNADLIFKQNANYYGKDSQL